MLVLLTLALTSGSRVFEYEYDGERNFSNPSKTSKPRKSKSGAIPSSAYNTLDGELMELIESSYEEQGGRSWQPFVEGKNGPENFRQARIYYFCDRCIVFARNRRSNSV